MTNTSIAMKQTAQFVTVAALLGASVYGLLGSAVGLAQAPALSLHGAFPIGINSAMVVLADQAAQ